MFCILADIEGKAANPKELNHEEHEGREKKPAKNKLLPFNTIAAAIHEIAATLQALIFLTLHYP